MTRRSIVRLVEGLVVAGLVFGVHLEVEGEFAEHSLDVLGSLVAGALYLRGRRVVEEWARSTGGS